MYVSTKNYKRIQAIAEAKREDGADRNETSISAICSMLLEVGLRIYEYQQKKEQEDNVESEGGHDELINSMELNKVLLENVIKTSYATTTLLQMVGSINEVKNVKSFNSYENIKTQIREKVDKDMAPFVKLKPVEP